jgi:hypothetical protein
MPNVGDPLRQDCGAYCRGIYNAVIAGVWSVTSIILPLSADFCVLSACVTRSQCDDGGREPGYSMSSLRSGMADRGKTK